MDIQATLIGMYDQEVSDHVDNLVIPSRFDVLKSMFPVKQRLKRSLKRLLKMNPFAI